MDQRTVYQRINAWVGPHVQKISVLRLTLVFLLSGICVAGGLLLAKINREIYQASRLHVERDVLSMTMLSLGKYQQFIEGSHQLLAGLSQVTDIKTHNIVACTELMVELNSQFPQYDNLALLDRHGNMICSAKPTPNPVFLGDRPWFKQVIETEEPANGGYQISRLTGKHIIVMAHPVNGNRGSIDGVLTAAVDLDYFSDLAAEIQLPAGSTITFFDQDGTILSRYPDSGSETGQLLPEFAQIQGISGQHQAGEYKGQDGRVRLYSNMTLPASPNIHVSIGIPLVDAVHDIYHVTERALTLLGIFIFLMVILAWWTYDRLIIVKLHQVAAAAQRLGAGDFSARSGLEHFSIGEISLLARVFDEMAQKLQEQHAQAENAALMLQQRLDQLAALRQIDKAITSTMSIAETMQILLEHAVNSFHADAGTVLLRDIHTGSLSQVTTLGLTDAESGDLAAALHEEGELAERRLLAIAKEGRAEFIADLNAFQASRPKRLVEAGFSSELRVPLVSKGNVTGLLQVFLRLPLRRAPERVQFLEALAGQAAIAVDNAILFNDLERSNREISKAYDQTIQGLSRALDLRDHETEGHSQRVTDMTIALAAFIGLNQQELVQIRRGALLHDIGKVGVPDAILLKPGPLNDEEWRIMRQHPQFAVDLLSPITFLRQAVVIPHYHHEKWDGSGYPCHLKGEEIPLPARIFAVVDVWDALRSDRPYRPALSPEETAKYIASQRGIHFDPIVVDAFFEMLEDQNSELLVRWADLA